jgi:hypothetical protein
MDGKNLYYFGISNIVSWRQPLRRNPCLPDRQAFIVPFSWQQIFKSLKEPSSAAFQLHGTKEDI